MIEIDGRSPGNIHFKWSKGIKPIARVQNGGSVQLIVPDSSTMQVQESWKTADLKKLNKKLVNGAVGPIWVEEAMKGDTLEIEIMDIKAGIWAFSTTEQNAGLIKGRFNDNLNIWKLSNGFAESEMEFLKGTKIPLNPFLGVMGVAPEYGEYGMSVPQSFGGNMDNKLLTVGSVLHLPVFTQGGLFSVADPHAAQGDGEAGTTGLETSATVVLRLKVIKGRTIRFPRAISKQDSKQLVVTMGISDDLYVASKFAMEEMIDELVGRGY